MLLGQTAFDVCRILLIFLFLFTILSGGGGTRRAFEALRLLLGETCIDERTLRRTQRAHRTDLESISRTLEGACTTALWNTMTMGSDGAGISRGDPRMTPISPDVADAVTAKGATRALREVILHAVGLEILVVGDFDMKEVEDCAVAYLGTLPREPKPCQGSFDICVADKPRRVDVTVPDDSVRTSLALMFGSVNRWGRFTGPSGSGEMCWSIGDRLRGMDDKHGNMFINR